MAMIRHELDTLRHFLPEGAAEDVIAYLHQYHIKLMIRRERKSILGDYRPAHAGKPHTISVNGNLNPYHFLVTFLHELAHLMTYINHQRRVSPHGTEWQQCFAGLLADFTKKAIFPPDLQAAIQRSQQRITASTCSDPELYRALSRYDPSKDTVRVESLAIDAHFRTDDGRQFRLIAKRRTRYECRETASGRTYLFPGIFEVYKE